MAIAKLKIQKLVFSPTSQKIVGFLNEIQKVAKDTFRIAVHVIIEQSIYGIKPPYLKNQ